MRVSALMISAFLMLAGGFDSPARAETEVIEFSPKMALAVNDGWLNPEWQEKLDKARGTPIHKGMLTFLLSDPDKYSSYFNMGSTLVLDSEDPVPEVVGRDSSPPGRPEVWPGSGRLVVFYWRETAHGTFFNFSAALNSPLEKDGELEMLLKSAEARVRIDDWLIEADNWKVTGQEGSLSEFLIHPVLFSSFEARREFDSQVLSALRRGRKANIEVVFTNGEKMSANFGLSGLDQALTLLAQKNYETDRTMEREVEALKKQLEALE